MTDPDADDVSALMVLLNERFVFALTSATDAEPHATPLFYAARTDPGPQLVFVTDPQTRHGVEIGAGPTLAAGCVYLEAREVSQLRGVQFRGRCVREDALPATVAQAAREAYLEAHPAAASVLSASAAQIYVLALTWAKVTDNRRGFGHKTLLAFSLPLWAAATARAVEA